MRLMGFPGGPMGKKIHLPLQETQVQSLGQKYPLEKEIATHSSILAWEIHGQRSLMSYSPWGCKRGEHNLANKQ